jgi:prevent-host-death family protein
MGATEGTVGVRELRQNLSVYLRRVAKGEVFEVTEHGHPVALLSPLRARMGTRERLIAEGRLIPATGDLLSLGPPLDVPLRMSSKEALDLEKEERLP